MSDANINIVTTVLKGGREPGNWDRVVVEKPLDSKALKTNLTAFVGMLEGVFADNGLSKGLLASEFLLDELTFVAEIDPDGNLRLRGDCGKHSGGVKIKMKRRRTNHTADQHLLTSKQDQDELKVVVGSSVASDTVKVDIVQGNIDANILPQPLLVVIGA